MSSKPPARQDEAISQYIHQLQRRHVIFRKEHDAELRHMRHDFVARLISEHIVFGERSAYESLLEGMLNNEERDRLHSDQKFTQAWRIFVDMCWMKKQLQRAALILAAIVFAMVAVLVFLVAIPQVARNPAP